jgi:hypothetical protein
VREDSASSSLEHDALDLEILRRELPKLGRAFDGYLEGGKAKYLDLSTPGFCYRNVVVHDLLFKYNKETLRPNAMRVMAYVTWNVPIEVHSLVQAGVNLHRQMMEQEFQHVYDYDEEEPRRVVSRADAGEAIRLIRTVLYFFYKLEKNPTVEQVSAAMASFKANEDRVQSQWYGSPSYQRRIEVAQQLADRLFKDFPRSSLNHKHGPGSVATGERNDEKWHMMRYSKSLHRILPWYESIGGLRSSDIEHNINYLRRYWEIDWVETWTSKVVFVPKDSRGPRTICAEPLELQYLQQGVARKVVETIERHPLTRGKINFDDQDINGNLALGSSDPLGSNMATIDMKDASDLVSWRLVKMLFPRGIAEILAVTRSTAVLFPNGERMDIEKYAPMGSALCFPVESFVFWSLAVAALVHEGLSVQVAAASVYVFGDDIIVPTQYVSVVVGNLEAFGLLVNQDKSCYRGFFRESCGVDGYLGEVVTPQRIKKNLPVKHTDGGSIVAWAAYSDQLHWLGCHHTRDFIDDWLQSILGEIPVTAVQQSFVSFVRGYNDLRGLKTRWSESRCAVEVFSWAVRPKSRVTPLDGAERLLRSLTSDLRDSDPSRYVARDATLMTKRWNPVHH